MQLYKNYKERGCSIALQHPVSKRTLCPTNMCPAKLFKWMRNIVLALLNKTINITESQNNGKSWFNTENKIIHQKKHYIKTGSWKWKWEDIDIVWVTFTRATAAIACMSHVDAIWALKWVTGQKNHCICRAPQDWKSTVQWFVSQYKWFM